MQVGEEITIQVTPQVAKAYQLATEKEKQRLSAYSFALPSDNAYFFMIYPFFQQSLPTFFKILKGCSALTNSNSA
jgi:hypothetical protein